MLASLCLVAAVLTPRSAAAWEPPQNQASTPTAAALARKEPLAVLYAGEPGSEREARWLAFLRAECARAESVDLRKLTPGAAADFDVVVADWSRRYVAGADGKYEFDSDSGHGATLPSALEKPVILLGAVGGEVARASKIGWL